MLKKLYFLVFALLCASVGDSFAQKLQASTGIMLVACTDGSGNVTACNAGGGGSTVTANQGTPAAIANAWPIYISQSGAVVSSGNPLYVSVTSSGLPTGAATAALQSNVQSAPGTSQTVALTVQGNASGIAVPVSAASLPLPSGAATSALQTTENTSLSTIATNSAAGIGTSAGGTTPTNMIEAGAQYLASPPTLANGQGAGLMSDVNGRLLTNDYGNLMAGSTYTAGVTPFIDIGAQAAATTTNPAYTAGQNSPTYVALNGALRTYLSGTANTASAMQQFTSPSNASNASVGIACQYMTSQTEATTGQSNGVACNQYSAVQVDAEGTKPSYISSFSVTPSAAGMFGQICGSSTKVIRLRYVTIQGDATTAGIVTLTATKTSTASGSSGTSVTPTPQDATNDSAATAGVTYYTTVGTAGTSVGSVGQQLYYVPLAANVGSPVGLSFGNSTGTQSVVLRTATQCVALATSGTLPTGSSFIVNITHTEE